MEQLQQLLLHLRLQVDQQIAAAHQIQFGERRIGQDVLRCEQHGFPQLLAHLPVVGIGPGEKSLQLLAREVSHQCFRVDAAAGHFEGDLVHVGGKDLDRAGLARRGDALDEQHGDRIGLLPGGAAGHPHPYRGVRFARHEQFGQHLGLQELEHFGIAKKAGDADQQVLAQLGELVRPLAQQRQVVGKPVQVVEPHAPQHAAQQHALAVGAEIELGARPQQGKHLAQVVLDGSRFGMRGGSGGEVPHVFEQFLRHLTGRQHVVRQPGVDGGERHAVVLGAGRLLHHGHPALGLDGLEPKGTVGAGTGQDDADGPLLLVRGQRAQERVDGGLAGPMFRRGAQLDDALVQGQVAVGGNDVDMVGLDALAVPGFRHRHGGLLGQQRGHQAFVLGVEVGNEHKGHPAVCRHRLEELLEGFQAARRGDHAHHRLGQPRGGFRVLCIR